MAHNLYQRYMWLVRAIYQSREGLTSDEIRRRWECSSLNTNGEKLPRRTFHNWINAIRDTFGIHIECTKTAPYRYHIDKSMLENDDLMKWVLNAFSIGLMAAENSKIKDRILLEEIPSADERLDIILSAMRSNHRIQMTYKPFGREENTYVTEPYAVKLSRNRWYVICHSEKHNREFTYGVDRIVDVKEVEEDFCLKSDYCAKRAFEGCIGITVDENVDIQDVRLKITGYLCDYIETLPLHSTQKLIEQTHDYAIYAYQLRPDNELVDTICGMGGCCEVLEPQVLRRKVYSAAKSIMEKNR